MLSKLQGSKRWRQEKDSGSRAYGPPLGLFPPRANRDNEFCTHTTRENKPGKYMWKAPKPQMNASHLSAQLSPHVMSFLLARVPSPSTEPTLHILYCFYIFSHGCDSPNRPEKAWIWGITCLCPRPNNLGTGAWLPGPSHPAAPVLIHTAPSHRMN